MLLLGIDTSAKKGILCLGNREKILARKTISAGLSSGELIPALDTLMKKKKIKKEDLEAVANLFFLFYGPDLFGKSSGS